MTILNEQIEYLNRQIQRQEEFIRHANESLKPKKYLFWLISIPCDVSTRVRVAQVVKINLEIIKGIELQIKELKAIQ